MSMQRHVPWPQAPKNAGAGGTGQRGRLGVKGAMDSGALGWIVGGVVSAWFAWRVWRRFDVRPLAVTYDSSPGDEPCWTERITTDGRLSYGRSGCYHSGLAEMEARARSGEFDTPA